MSGVREATIKKQTTPLSSEGKVSFVAERKKGKP